MVQVSRLYLEGYCYWLCVCACVTYSVTMQRLSFYVMAVVYQQLIHTRNPVQTKQLGPFRFLLHEWNLKNTQNKKSIEGIRNNFVWNRISTLILSELSVPLHWTPGLLFQHLQSPHVGGRQACHPKVQPLGPLEQCLRWRERFVGLSGLTVSFLCATISEECVSKVSFVCLSVCLLVCVTFMEYVRICLEEFIVRCWNVDKVLWVCFCFCFLNFKQTNKYI